MLTRLTISLDKLERDALKEAALAECRDVRQHARYLLRRELEQAGLLQTVMPPKNDHEEDLGHEQADPA